MLPTAPKRKIILPAANLPHMCVEVRQHFAAMFGAFPDMRVTIEDMVAEGDKVAVRLADHGTLPAGVMGRAESVTGTGLAILRVLDGRIVESWGEAVTPRRVVTYELEK